MPDPEREGFLRVPNAFLVPGRIGALTGIQLKVLLCAASFDYGRGSSVSDKTIAKALNTVDARGMGRALREVAVLGFAKRIQDGTGGGWSNTSIWTFNFVPELSRVQRGIRWLATAIDWQDLKIASIFYSGELPEEPAQTRGEIPPRSEIPTRGGNASQPGGIFAPTRGGNPPPNKTNKTIEEESSSDAHASARADDVDAVWKFLQDVCGIDRHAGTEEGADGATLHQVQLLWNKYRSKNNASAKMAAAIMRHHWERLPSQAPAPPIRRTDEERESIAQKVIDEELEKRRAKNRPRLGQGVAHAPQ